MRDEFFEYFQPSKADFEKIWAKCVFSFDASVLLDLYRFSASSREELLAAMRTVRPRIWLSHQAAFEFNKHRLEIMADAHSRADKLIQRITDLSAALTNEAAQHPYLDAGLCAPICDFLAQSAEKIKNIKASSPSEDSVGEELLDLFYERVGKPYSEERLIELRREIEIRYEKKFLRGTWISKKRISPAALGILMGIAYFGSS